MTKDTTPPDIDSLLQNQGWESKLAAARTRREAILAARAEAEAPPTGQPSRSTTPTPSGFTAAPELQQPRKTGIRLAAVVVIIAAIAGGAAIWLL